MHTTPWNEISKSVRERAEAENLAFNQAHALASPAVVALFPKLIEAMRAPFDESSLSEKDVGPLSSHDRIIYECALEDPTCLTGADINSLLKLSLLHFLTREFIVFDLKTTGNKNKPPHQLILVAIRNSDDGILLSGDFPPIHRT